MKTTVKIEDVSVIIERPNFTDYGGKEGHGQEFRQNTMKDTIIPMLEEATNNAKELYRLKQ